jgi:hypothetical protein
MPSLQISYLDNVKPLSHQLEVDHRKASGQYNLTIKHDRMCRSYPGPANNNFFRPIDQFVMHLQNLSGQSSEPQMSPRRRASFFQSGFNELRLGFSVSFPIGTVFLGQLLLQLIILLSYIWVRAQIISKQQVPLPEIARPLNHVQVKMLVRGTLWSFAEEASFRN